ncbi:hypothetical protein C8Z91_34770 [Paenibacillus elgii]|uniref:Transposase-like Mu C-terminal domain-containing protein n=1 Tax=Paenibacillus elgii TaxID=189691 RepID=A0A2T6FRT3_9BACL|nr:hypothetical protein [Paenibacillus elgii]PUA34631.1 hypothetical protein C8Z91_34770 [Paenibacillus elgii]
MWTLPVALCLDGNKYEVERVLAGQQIVLRYAPFDLSIIQMWKDEQRFKDTVVLDLTRKRKRRVEKTVDVVMEQKRQQQWADDPVQFAAKSGGEVR